MPPEPEPPRSRYWLDLSLSTNWIWKNMLPHRWRSILVQISVNPNGFIFISPFYDKDAKNQLGVDWFKTVQDCVEFIRPLLPLRVQHAARGSRSCSSNPDGGGLGLGFCCRGVLWNGVEATFVT